MRRAREERTSRTKVAREVSGSWDAANRYLSNRNVIFVFLCFLCIFVFVSVLIIVIIYQRINFTS